LPFRPVLLLLSSLCVIQYGVKAHLEIRMKLSKSASLSTTFGLSLLLAGTWPSVVLAEEEEVEELVVIGTRAQPRSVLDSSVPIDVIDNESLTTKAPAT